MSKKAPGCIRLRGVRQNNLKNIDLDVPLGQLVVISGLSGSGKSSLAFDTLFAEGQRRYIETFSPYARQFLDRMDKPQARRIEGIPPAIAIEQRNSVKSTRSTVGTMTEIADYTKVFWAQLARLHCRRCGKPVSQEPPQKHLAGRCARWRGRRRRGHVHAGFERKVFAGGIAGAGGTAGLPAAAGGGGGARTGRGAGAAEKFAARPVDGDSGPGEVEGVEPGAVCGGVRSGLSFWEGETGGALAGGGGRGFADATFFQSPALRGVRPGVSGAFAGLVQFQSSGRGRARRARDLGG